MASEGSASNWSISDLKLVSYFIKIYWFRHFSYFSPWKQNKPYAISTWLNVFCIMY